MYGQNTSRSNAAEKVARFSLSYCNHSSQSKERKQNLIKKHNLCSSLQLSNMQEIKATRVFSYNDLKWNPKDQPTYHKKCAK